MTRKAHTPMHLTLRNTALAACTTGLILAGCASSKSAATATTSASTGAPTTASTGAPSTSGAGTTAASASPTGISAERCAENKKAGKITYLSGFDLAASASIVEIVVAKEKGYFDKMCLDVDVKASFATANYPLVGSNTAQFASGGSYTELLNFQKDGAQFVAVAIDGKVGIDALLVRPGGGVTKPADLKGKTIGVKGALAPSNVAFLSSNGLTEGKDYNEVSLDGFDPKQHWALPIDALPVYKSNEPGQLDAAGIKYVMFDPASAGIPGDFGVIYTSKKFHDEHPSAVQDFLRASMKGLADAISKPDDAVALCFKKITENGNKNFLSNAGEAYRWGVESKLVTDNTPKGEGLGLVHAADLQKLVDAYTAAGVYQTKPSIDGTYDEQSIKGIYGADGTVIWPSA